MKKLALAALLTLGALASAQAAENGVYAGASLGYANGDADDFSPLVHNQSGTPFKTFVGYQFTKYVSAEASYTDVGSFNFTYDSSTTHLGSDYRIKSYGLSAVGSYPIDDFTLFARLGADYNTVKLQYAESVSGVYSAGAVSKNKVNVLYGAGASYALTKSLDLRLEYESLGTAGSQSSTGRMKNVFTFTSGLVYHF
jgi:opacity protein-like surface antigen